MNVKLSYAKGWRLQFPKHGNAPMLFLEWLMNIQHELKTQLSYSIATAIAEDEILNDNFIMTLNTSKEIANQCFFYINENL